MTNDVKSPREGRKRKHFAAGAFSAATATVLTSPLDVLKTMFQASKGKDPTVRKAMRSVLAKEGTRGLFKGLGPSVLGIAPTWAIYFTTYDHIRYLLEEGSWNPIHIDVAASAFAGGVAAAVTNPLWVVKVRLQTRSIQRYRNYIGCVRSIYHHYGIPGFYRGLSASMLGVLHVGIQFPLYEGLKRQLKYDKLDPDPATIAVASAVSKVIASTSTYPHEVIRTRLQATGKYGSMREVIICMYREEGIQSFYNGIAPNILKAVPTCVITFTIYEILSSLIEQHQDQISRSAGLYSGESSQTEE